MVRTEEPFVVPLAPSAAFHRPREAGTRAALGRLGIDFPYILYVGSLEPRKNLARLVEAYAVLRGWSTRWKLVVVGAARWECTSLFSTIHRLGLSAHVHFTGLVDDEDLSALYSGADLFVYPSLLEGFGLPVIEAMACGTPVVTSAVSSLPEVAGGAAVLIDPYDPRAIARAIREILEQPSRVTELRVAGLKRSRQLTWHRTARETIRVYERVLGREPIRADAGVSQAGNS